MNLERQLNAAFRDINLFVGASEDEDFINGKDENNLLVLKK